MSPQFNGKEATIFIHKYAQPSDYTNEYIGTVTINDGKIILSDVKLRERPAVQTGDFTVVASIKGCSSMIELGKIEAPKPQYKVTYFDFDGNPIDGCSYTVTAGGTAPIPSIDKVHPNEGYRFVRWNQSTVNVQSDLNVYPEQERKTVVVVFVDWVSQKVTLNEMFYGDEIITPVLPQADDGVAVYWDMSNASAIEETLDDGTKVQRFIATENTVITTTFEKIEYTVNFISPTVVKPTENPDDININLESIEDFEESEYISVETANYQSAITIPEFDEDNDDYIFYGWINIQTGEYLEDDAVTLNATYYPVYDFAKTASEPEADIKTGEYTTDQTITLTTDTENAVIYYTTDGSNPKTSSTVMEYTEPISLHQPTTLKFYAAGMMMNDSSVITELYAINTATSGVPYHLVSVYSSLDNTNIFYALVKDSAKLNLASISTIEGGTFDGVFLDEEYKNEFYYKAENVTESLTLYAKYTLDTHTVTFKDYDDTVLGTISVDYGNSAEYTPPVRDGYVFIGWDQDIDYVTEDITTIAKYVPENEYATVKFSINDKSVDVGGIVKLFATVTPENLDDVSLFWYSEDESIATVDENGYVTAVSPGQTKIIAYVNTTGESAECNFIVNGDKSKNLVINRLAKFGYDSEGYIRGINENDTAKYVASYFDNETGVYVYSKDNQLLNNDNIVTTGSTVKLIIDDNEIDSKTIVMTGDINCDGHIGNADIIMLKQWLEKTIDLSYAQQLACDVNGDGNVDNKDVTIISRYLVGKEKI